MLSNDDAPPCDRPNLSKDYLAGNAPEDTTMMEQPTEITQFIFGLPLRPKPAGDGRVAASACGGNFKVSHYPTSDRFGLPPGSPSGPRSSPPAARTNRRFGACAAI
jgi:hypothetical protein